MFGLRPVDGINALILVVAIWVLVRVINSETNAIIIADFISTRGTDGKPHGDLNKLLQLSGGLVGCITALLYADNDKVDALGLAAVLGVVLGFCAGPAMWAANLRSKQGSVETTKITEPAAAPAKVTETTLQTPPLATPVGGQGDRA